MSQGIPVVQIVGTDGQSYIPVQSVQDGLRVSQYQWNNSFGQNLWVPFQSNTCFTVLASASRTATTNSSDFENVNWKGINLYLDITAGTTNLTPTIQAFDGLSNKYFDVLTLTTRGGIGQYPYEVYPGIVESAGPSNDHFNHSMPRVFRIQVIHANANPVTYSIGATFLV